MTFRRAPGYVWRWCGGTHVLLIGPDGSPRRLLGAAAVVWSLLDQDRTWDSMVEALGAWTEPDLARRADPVARAALALLVTDELVLADGTS